MIRLILGLSGVFLLWLWLFSPFSRRAKTITTIVAIVLFVALVSYESYDNKPRYGLIEPNQVPLCGSQVRYSYRTDYKLALCIDNTSSRTIKRLTFDVLAKQCDAVGQCNELELVSRDLPITVAPNGRYEFTETLRFDQLEAGAKDVIWEVSVTAVKAIP